MVAVHTQRFGSNHSFKLKEVERGLQQSVRLPIVSDITGLVEKRLLARESRLRFFQSVRARTLEANLAVWTIQLHLES